MISKELQIKPGRRVIQRLSKLVLKHGDVVTTASSFIRGIVGRRPVEQNAFVANKVFSSLAEKRCLMSKANISEMSDREDRRPPTGVSLASQPEARLKPVKEQCVPFWPAKAAVQGYTAQAGSSELMVEALAPGEELPPQWSIISRLPDAVICMNDRGTAFWNPAAEQLFGYAAHEVHGLPLDTIFPIGGLTERSEGVVERVGRHRDGTELPLEISVARWTERGQSCLVAVIRDISARRREQRERLEGEQRFTLLVKGVVDYAIYMLDPDGIVTNWNAGAERIKGYVAEEIIGHHFSRFYTDADRSAEVPSAVLAIARQHGKYQGEGWRVRKDGSRFWAEAVIDRIHDENGRIIGFAKVTHDITEKRNAQLALLRSERKLKAYAQMAADWFWEQDADLRFVMDSEIPLVTRPTDVGKMRWDLADPAMDPRRWEDHKAALAARKPFRDFRWERIGTDGKRHHLSTSGDPIFDDSGTFLGYHGTGRDRTAEVEAAERLRVAKEGAEAANRAKSEFLANMSHELRTPLHAIIGFAELIHDQTAGPIARDYVAWADEVIGGGRHLLGLINELLDLSKIEAGHYELLDDQLDLSVVARACIAAVRLQAEMRHVRLECTMTETGPSLLADRRAVKQIMLSLVTNSVKFTPADGVVSVRSERQADGRIALIVADTGVGIDPAKLKMLREPFAQADASFARKHGGMGLGLALSGKLAALHGGELTIESTPGHGTTVQVIFPGSRVIAKSQNSLAVAHGFG